MVKIVKGTFNWSCEELVDPSYLVSVPLDPLAFLCQDDFCNLYDNIKFQDYPLFLRAWRVSCLLRALNNICLTKNSWNKSLVSGKMSVFLSNVSCFILGVCYFVSFILFSICKMYEIFFLFNILTEAKISLNFRLTKNRHTYLKFRWCFSVIRSVSMCVRETTLHKFETSQYVFLKVYFVSGTSTWVESTKILSATYLQPQKIFYTEQFLRKLYSRFETQQTESLNLVTALKGRNFYVNKQNNIKSNIEGRTSSKAECRK